MFSRVSFINVLLLIFFSVAAANAATFIVTKTADTADGVCNSDCSFREALTAANENGGGADIINFSIPGSGVKTILLTSDLPHVRTSLTINGQTQTGYFGKPMIEFRGGAGVSEAFHLVQPAPDGPMTVVIYAVAINSFSQYGIQSTCGDFPCDLVVKGCFIGTDPTGEIDMGNGFDGIHVFPSNGSVITIGGSGPFEGNVISGNGGAETGNVQTGIVIEPVPMSEENQGAITVNIIGNKIGTDFDGLTDLGNTDDGIYVTERALNGAFEAWEIELNVGGATQSARNIISGNDGMGIYANVRRANIRGNYIGVDASGTVAMGNEDPDDQDDGISILPHPDGTYQIGGSSAGEGNVISNNGGDGIEFNTYVAFAADDVPVLILGNKIGTNAAGTADMGNGQSGIWVGQIASLNLSVKIGDVGNGANLISGNASHGINVSGEKVDIYGNKIGTNIDGTAAIANGADGIHVAPFIGNTIDVTVGGTAVINGESYDRGNLVSGNLGNGIFVQTYEGPNNPVTIKRNRIGTNATATSAIPNLVNGIRLMDAGATIGSSTHAVDGNVISGNGTNGISILGDGGASPAAIHANKIGTNGVGGSPLANGDAGIYINNSANNQIGLAGVPATANVIAGNGGPGVTITGAASSGNRLENNMIGTGPVLNDLGNVGPGVYILGGASNNFVGSGNGTGNTIAFNQKGIWTSSGLDNEIRRNAIFTNDELGIDLDLAGVTPNDLGDGDMGANRKQNFPVLGRVTPSAISGVLNSTPNGNFTIDFYRAESCDANGHGEGRYFLGSALVVTDASGNASFNYPATVALGQLVTATATVTDVLAADDTSEFSQCKVVTPAPTVAFSSAAYSVNEGAASRTIVVNRSGATDGVVSVSYATSNGTATAGQDYTATSGTLTFAEGEIIKTFDVLVSNDNLDEPDETVNITLSNPTNGAALGTQSTTVLTIADNDPTPAVSVNSVSANEGNSGTTVFTFSVTLSAPSGQNVSVIFATDGGTATPFADYTSIFGTLNFGPTEVSKTVTVHVIGDTTEEPTETFFLELSAPVNATLGGGPGVGTIVNDDNQATPPRTRFDYDGDSKADVSIFRPSNGQWWIDRSTAGVVAGTFGISSDRIVPADYTGDGKTDIAIWRPSTGEWFVLRSEDSSYYSFPFGSLDDIPAPADYDGDGKADPAVFRPSNATWYINKSTGGTLITAFGANGDLPVVDDYDRDGMADLAIFRPSNGQWWLNRSTAGVIVAMFGTSSDKQMHGDFTGDGKADIAFWRPATGEWFVLRSEDLSYFSFPFGANGDKPSVADFDGDGRVDPAVFRPSAATWYINRSTQGIYIQTFGVNGDVPTTAAYVP